jgi:enoyl-CoA hydratase/carnithine racemase
LAGHLGEYLGLTGQVLHGSQAVQAGLADGFVDAAQLPQWWSTLCQTSFETGAQVLAWLQDRLQAVPQAPLPHLASIHAVFGLRSVGDMLAQLDAMAQLNGSEMGAAHAQTQVQPQAQGDADPHASEWAKRTAHSLRQHSPLMLHVTLGQIRRARQLTLAQALRLERDMVRHCFALRPLTQSETVEGIRALAIEKDRNPQWQPAQVSQVDAAEVAAFFQSPWPAHAHPLRDLV